MTIHTEGWIRLALEVFPILIKLLFGKKETKKLLLTHWKQIDPKQRNK